MNNLLIKCSHKTLRRTSTVPEEIKSASKINDVLGGLVFPNVQSLNGTPDSILSGSLLEGGGTSVESEAPTAPFPFISRSSSPLIAENLDDNFLDSKLLSRTNTRMRMREKIINKSKENIQRAFGSPVTPDEQFHNQPI